MTVGEAAHRDTTTNPGWMIGPLYAAGAILGLLWLAVGGAPGVAVLPAAVLIVLTALIAGLLIWKNSPVGALVTSGLVAGGSLLVTAAIIVAGTEAPFAVLYLWAGAMTACLVPRAHTPWHIGLTAAGYAVALAADPDRPPGLQGDAGAWAVTVGAVIIVVLIVRRLTDAAEAGSEISRRAAQRQAVVARLGQQALSARLSTVPVMTAATEAMLDALDAEYSKVLEYRDEQLFLRAGCGWRPGAVGSAVAEVDDGTQAGYTLGTSTAVVVDDFAQETRFRRPRLLETHGVRSGMSVVIPGGDRPYGVLGVHSTAARRFDADDVAFLESVANVIAAAVARERAEEELVRSALQDPLTGAANRILFEDRVEAALTRAAATDGKLVAVVCVDIDAFGSVNQLHGQRSGDHLLRQLPARLASVAPGATVGRLGGDHFAALAEGLGSETEAYAMAIAIRRQFEVPFELPAGPQMLSAGVGIAVTGATDSASDFIRDAEAAMRRAKERGDGSIELFDEEMRVHMTERTHLEEQLRRAIRDDELRLLFQPIVSLPSGRLTGAEALVRWQHPQRGLVGPSEFIPIAEQSHLIIEIGDWVLDEACRQLAQWQNGLPGAGFRLSVNVSARQISVDGFAGEMAARMSAAGIAPDRLALELTESAVTENAPRSAENIRRLQELGVAVLLDDFGTGYASLQRIRLFRFDGIKLDRSFVAGLDESDSDAALVAAAIAMGHALEIDIVAEGIESEGQATALTGMGCPHGQGYRYARPLPAEAIRNLFLSPAGLA